MSGVGLGRRSSISSAVGELELDHDLSPLTGWTRRHHALVADRQLLALRPWASVGKARFELPGPASRAGRASDGLEAFARSFLTAGFLLAGSGSDPHDHAGWYATGLAAGSDPAAVDRWPRMREIRQSRVEAAALVIGLHESRRQLWDRLGVGVQERMIDWLSESVGGGYGDNNWRWFQNVTQAFLRSVGAPYDQDGIDRNLAFLDDCYLGDGWYSDGRPDGRSGSIDWYNAWVMHLFALWYCRILGDQAPTGLLDRYRERLAAFLPQGARLFGDDGAPLFQGRSLVYRFATTAAFWAGPVFDVDAIGPGLTRRIGSGALRYFVERGAFDDHDLLSLGWHGRFEPMRQPYSGPGSPYWSGLGFAGLVLGEDHPVWTEVEREVPAEEIRAVRPPGWLVGRHQGVVRIVNHGTDHSGASPGVEDPQYCRFGYSSATAPVPIAGGHRDGYAPADNQVVLRTPDGRWSHRRPIELVAVDGNIAVSRQLVHFASTESEAGAAAAMEPAARIVVGSALRGSLEVRAVRVGIAGTAERLVISGFAVPEAPDGSSDRGLRSAVYPLYGGLTVGRSVFPLANPFGETLGVDWAAPSGPPEPAKLYAVAVELAGAGDPEPDLPELSWNDPVLRIGWPDGSVDVLPLESPV